MVTGVSDDLLAQLRDSIKVSAAIPAGEVWLTSGCSWAETHPGPHGEPEWRADGMCVHEHLERALLCTRCREALELWRKTQVEPPGPWCGACYEMWPGGHHCTATVEFTRL